MTHPLNPDKLVPCKACGCTLCAWGKTDAGKFVLLQKFSTGKWGGSEWILHSKMQCDIYARQSGRAADDLLDAYAQQVGA